ncbi:hypothetical protein ACFFRR_005138 [Megaselia abdita]
MNLVTITAKTIDVRDPHGYFMTRKSEQTSPVKEIKVVENGIPKIKRNQFRKSRTTSKNFQFDRSKGVLEISKNTISEICKYHKNMARHHPTITRSRQEQEKRDKNTKACRLSRRAKKLEEIIMEEEYQENLKMHDEVVEETIRSLFYMKQLLELMRE